MSMQSNCVYGIGFNTDTITKEALLAFINKHSTDKAIENIDELLDIECMVTGQRGLHAIIANIMNEETGIQFQYEPGQEDTDSSPAVLFAPMYPWHMNFTEKLLSMPKLLEIIKPYMKELGVEGEPDEIRVEYFG